MRIAAVQLDMAWEDKDANHRTIERMLEEAEVPTGAFVLLPELADTGFSFDLDAIVDDRSLAWARRLARRRGVWVQAGYATRTPPPAGDGKGRNCATIIDPEGSVVGTYAKVHPFSFGRESEHFVGGDHLLLRRCAMATVCPLICYDLRFPELWRHGVLAGAEVFTIGASWPEARQHHWHALAIARAIENQAYVIAVNRVGADPHLTYAGGSLIVDPMGRVLVEAGRAPYVLQKDLDLVAVRRWRRTFPALADVRRGLLGSIRLDRDAATETASAEAESAAAAGIDANGVPPPPPPATA